MDETNGAMDMTRRLLAPETYDQLIDRDQSPTDLSKDDKVFIEFFALCEAYRGASNTTDWYRKSGDHKAAAITARTRDRFYRDLKPLGQKVSILFKQ
jgi:hypothetical protein